MNVFDAYFSNQAKHIIIVIIIKNAMTKIIRKCK